MTWLLACLLAAAPCASAPSPTPVSVVSESYGCEARLPAGWKGRTRNLREGQVFLAYKATAAYAQLRAEGAPKGGAGDVWNPVEMHANARMSEELRLYRRIRILTVRPAKVGDAEGLERTALWEAPGGARLKGTKTWFVRDRKVFCFVCQAPEGDFSGIQPECARILGSLAFRDGTTPRPGR